METILKTRPVYEMRLIFSTSGGKFPREVNEVILRRRYNYRFQCVLAMKLAFGTWNAGKIYERVDDDGSMIEVYLTWTKITLEITEV